ncbi:MAG: hypothetical protein KGL96_05405 [Hyphomicrobiales bacterium]|jgi:hypothetical protein|nr:hypothetical protein [Hyphomicrobiales bacterium]
MRHQARAVIFPAKATTTTVCAPTEDGAISIIPLLANSSFDPEAIEILSAAFDDAWEKLKASNSDFARPAYERGAREIIAKHIIEAAQRGERDRRRLCESALKFLAENYKH